MKQYVIKHIVRIVSISIVIGVAYLLKWIVPIFDDTSIEWIIAVLAVMIGIDNTFDISKIKINK